MSVSEASITTEDALVERLFGATVQALDLFGVYLGKKLGLYDAHACGPAGRPRGPGRDRGHRPPLNSRASFRRFTALMPKCAMTGATRLPVAE